MTQTGFKRAALILLVLFLVPASAVKSGSKKSVKKSAKKKLSRVEQVKKDQARIARDWYNILQERLTDFPADAVKGRRIVIDPGHTGLTPGAEGPGRRIIEADVNWGVARNLAKVLNDAGARATLTKSYGPPKPPELRDMDADLDQRAELSNREQADLFISIHHNWNGDPATNHTEIYYKLDDLGPSRDAANYVMIHMNRNLGLDASIIPSNFRVLRVNRRPALLTEASYISNPLQESLLADTNKQKLEAQAIYIGVLDYFAHGVPEFRLLTAPGDISGSGRPQLRVKASDRFGIDRNTVRVTFDGRTAKSDYLTADSVFLITSDQALANGRHKLRFEGRNLKGNSGIPLELSFLTDREPERITITPIPRICPPGSVSMEIRVRVFDHEGQPVADTRRAVFVVDKQPFGDSALQDGSARIYIRRDRPDQVPITVRCGRASASIVVTFAPVKSPLVQFRIGQGDSLRPVPGALVLDDWRSDTLAANRDGVLTLQPPPGSHRFGFAAMGFRRTSLELSLAERSTTVQRVKLEPLLDGVLARARIVLDPAGGYFLPDTSGELSTFSFGVARRLRVLLERTGATVQITRRENEILARPDRVAAMSDFHPDYYLKLSSHAANAFHRTRIGHYPGSERGTALAQSLSIQLGSLPDIALPETTSERSYEIVNAPCPAVGVYARFSDPKADPPETDTALQASVARQLLLGLAAQYGARFVGPVKIRIVDQKDQPVRRAAVAVDDLLRYQADVCGKVNIPDIDAGIHTIRIDAPGYLFTESALEVKPALGPQSSTFRLVPLK